MLVSCSRFQLYEPQVSGTNELYVKPEMMTNEHKTNVIQVLEFYEVEWKEENGSIYIRSSVDRETMWNFTIKANDPEWLKTHQPGMYDKK